MDEFAEILILGNKTIPTVSTIGCTIRINFTPAEYTPTLEYIITKPIIILSRLEEIPFTNLKVNNVNSGLINEIQTYNGLDNTTINYTYDTKNRLHTITLPNSSVYEFVYDNKNRLVDIKLNNIVILRYGYNTNDFIVSQKYGINGGYYYFEYTTKGQIKKIYYSVNNINYLRFEYLYNSYDQLILIKDGQGNTLSSYSYDDDRLISESNDSLTEQLVRFQCSMADNKSSLSSS